MSSTSADRPLAGRNVPGGTIVTPSGAVMRPDDAAALGISQQYGVSANAEQLIEAHRSTQNPTLQRASLTQVDAEATAAAKEDLKGSASKLNVPDNAELIDVSVRGNALIGVIEYENGTIDKLVAGANDNWTPPKLSPEQAEQQASSERQAQVAMEVQRLQADFAQKLADTRVELQQQLAEEVAKIREDADSEISKVRDQAEQEQSSGGSGSSSSRSRSSSSRRRSGSRSSGRSGSSSSQSRSSRSESSGDSPQPAAPGSQLAEGVHGAEEKKGESSGAV